ncbi:unnamed protein product [Brachionus calyciflorus]|uniref:F-box domain-containing protein n=1 Tax=Brachionus calyciflorus TaxID=104777 RepID=A0A813WDX3_9BILA|nr:unnamed protein product [Brachionus calyciflorus]
MHQLPNEILLKIFKYLSFGDLVKSVNLTCKKWASLIEDKNFWLLKLKDERGVEIKFECDLKSLKFLYIKNPIERNLIQNSCCESLDKWSITNKIFNSIPFNLGNLQDFESDCFVIEEYNECSSSIYNELNLPIKKFATSSTFIFKYQIIDLYSEGLTKELLTNLKPVIHIKDSAGRLYLGYHYCIQIVLYDENFTILNSVCFNESVYEENWINGNWKEFNYSFREYSNNLRYVLFYHGGRDVVNWTGFYGVKLTNSQVVLKVEN